MTLQFKWGEFGEIHPIRCVDVKGADVSITYADVTKSKIYFLSESKTIIKLIITDADFTISTPVVNWNPTETQSEALVPGNYSGEIHLQDAGLTRKAIFEFPIFIEKAQGNI